ncbi:MAG: hypothetical protein QM811_13295 [Pirellulales bacterium]
MHEVLFHYQQVSPTTWVYLSSLLTIALFFKFNRVWSLRNFDLGLMILLAPGLVLLDYGQNMHYPSFALSGYLWLYSIGGLLLLRMLLDPAMVRRPLLEPNLSVGGMIFMGTALFVFLAGKVVTLEIPVDNLVASTAEHARRMKPAVEEPMETVQPLPPSLNQQFDQQDKPSLPTEAKTPAIIKPAFADATGSKEKTSPERETSEPADKPKPSEKKPLSEEEKLSRLGPGYWLVRSLPIISSPIYGDLHPGRSPNDEPTPEQALNERNFAASRTIAILSHLAIVLGIVMIGARHFGNFTTGVGAALLYLLIPYTTLYVGWVQHALPAAFITWAIVMYRRPMVAGLLIGLACGTIYYPLFLLPLWVSFYWHRGLWRFLGGVTLAIVLLVGVTALHANSMDEFTNNLRSMSGAIFPTMEPNGFWGLLEEKYRIYRLTVMAAHIALCGSFAIWPAQKNLGTLLSCSAAVMISTQFWSSFDGGIAIGWYLPLLLLTVFRPNLEDRVALSVLDEGKLTSRKLRLRIFPRAA